MIRRNSKLPGWLLLTGILAMSAAHAEPVIALIIDDLGFRQAESRRATQLPGPVACAVIPGTPHGARMARAAHASGKEVMLHLPMQPIDRKRAVGDHGIDLQTTRHGITAALQAGIEAVPHVSGVNNHMGSLITRHPGHMAWLMQELSDRDNLFFIDSYTTHESVALRVAREAGVAAKRRDVFLDHERSLEAITRELERAKRIARRNGQAVAIGHPFPETLEVLERELPHLEDQGFELVTISELMREEWNRI